MSRLLLENLSKSFGKTRAVNDLSLEVKHGEFMVVLGPSGAGKTTTLKLIAGVESPDSGKVFIGDRLVNALEPHKRNVAMAFESYALYPHFTVAENLAHPLKAPAREKKMSKAEIDKKVYETAELLNIHPLLDRLPRMLSNGQKQRVALGRAMVRDPEVMLLDEPISHLDAKLRHRMRTEFKALGSSAIKTTTLYVTHDYLEALSLADRLTVIQEGSVQQVGTPDEIFNMPRSIFVAKLMGHPQINMVECDVQQSGGQTQLMSKDGSICVEVPDKMRQMLEASNLNFVTMGIRPMHMTALNGKTQQTNTFDANVYVYERLGTKGVLTTEVGGRMIDVITPIERNFEINTNVRIGIDPNEIMIFDPKTEQNLIYN